MKCRNCKHLYKDWCVHKLDSPDPDLDRECKDYMQITNADRIRAMSDEELAKLLLDGCQGSKCDKQPQNEYGSVNCFECRKKWLQQPAEEDT